MKSLNNKIRNEIANSQYLRDLAKSDKLSQDKVTELYEQAKINDKKIIFLKHLSNALKENENETKNNNRRF